MTETYSTGTITLTNGSAVVTGDGTAWEIAQITGGTLYHEGLALLIATVDSDTQLTLKRAWTGATASGLAYDLVRDTAYDGQVARNAEILARLLAGMEAGTIFKYNAEGDTAGRDFYDTRPKGFAYLDISGSEPILWVKASNAEADWAGPFSYGVGPQGEQGIQGIQGIQGVQGYKGWTIETELVADGTRSVLRVADFIGGEGTKPSGTGLYIGNGGLVADIADAVDIRGATGPQGNRGVEFRGDWNAIDDYYIGDIVIDDDALANPATWISRADNTNSRPRDNPPDWALFPGSFADTVDDGLWSDAIISTINDGTWGA